MRLSADQEDSSESSSLPHFHPGQLASRMGMQSVENTVRTPDGSLGQTGDQSD